MFSIHLILLLISITLNYVTNFTCGLGLSTLHCWIRSFEYILHLGYKRDIVKHQARTPEEKLSVAHNKRVIQESFRKELHLLVDVPKQGFGNSNDGNTGLLLIQTSFLK